MANQHLHYFYGKTMSPFNELSIGHFVDIYSLKTIWHLDSSLTQRPREQCSLNKMNILIAHLSHCTSNKPTVVILFATFSQEVSNLLA